MFRIASDANEASLRTFEASEMHADNRPWSSDARPGGTGGPGDRYLPWADQ